jgi:membrane protease YdiL (CAAX protease family)
VVDATVQAERLVDWRVGRNAVLGVLGGILLFQVILYLAVVDYSASLPFDLTPDANGIVFYILLMFVAVLFLLAVSKSDIFQGGTWGRFLTRYAIAGAIGWVLISGVEAAYGGTSVVVSGAQRLALIAFLGVYVAPTEEILFRMALPAILAQKASPRLSWFVSCAILFPIAHTFAYLSTYGSFAGTEVLVAMIEAAIAGVVLWYIRVYAGLGAAIASHFVYDASILGALGALPLALTTHFSLVPI